MKAAPKAKASHPRFTIPIMPSNPFNVGAAPPQPEAPPAFVMQGNYGHKGVILALAKRKGSGWKCRFAVLDRYKTGTGLSSKRAKTTEMRNRYPFNYIYTKPFMTLSERYVRLPAP